LAIVAVVLRGLFVALQARRGQIKLAIDKNIPRDIDLDALELAELPGGGARVVARSFDEVNRQNNAVEMAAANAAALDLGQQADADDAIPILMDPVQLRDPVADTDEFDAELEDYNDTEQDEAEDYADDAATDADDILFDYNERPAHVDNLSRVSPDYPDEQDALADDNDEYDDYVDDELAASNSNERDENSDDTIVDEDDTDYASDEDDFDDDELEEELDDGELDEEYLEEEYLDDEQEYANYDPLEDEEDDEIDDSDLDFIKEDVDDFSMTAGERIGYSDKSRQTSLFSVTEEEPAAPRVPKAKRKSLFAAFKRKKPITQAAPSAVENPVTARDEE